MWDIKCPKCKGTIYNTIKRGSPDPYSRGTCSFLSWDGVGMLSRTSHRWMDFYWIDSTTLPFTWHEWLSAVSAISNQYEHLKHVKYERACSLGLRVKTHLQIFLVRMFTDDGKISPSGVWVVLLPPSLEKYCPEGNVFISADSVPSHLPWLFVPLFHLWYLPSGCLVAPQQLSLCIIQSHLCRDVTVRKPGVSKKQACSCTVTLWRAEELPLIF